MMEVMPEVGLVSMVANQHLVLENHQVPCSFFDEKKEECDLRALRLLLPRYHSYTVEERLGFVRRRHMGPCRYLSQIDLQLIAEVPGCIPEYCENTLILGLDAVDEDKGTISCLLRGPTVPWGPIRSPWYVNALPLENNWAENMVVGFKVPIK